MQPNVRPFPEPWLAPALGLLGRPRATFVPAAVVPCERLQLWWPCPEPCMGLFHLPHPSPLQRLPCCSLMHARTSLCMPASTSAEGQCGCCRGRELSMALAAPCPGPASPLGLSPGLVSAGSSALGMCSLASPRLHTAAAHSGCWHKRVLTSSSTPWAASPGLPHPTALTPCLCWVPSLSPKCVPWLSAPSALPHRMTRIGWDILPWRVEVFCNLHW